MSGRRHATDKVDGMIVASCPNGCAEVEVEYGHADPEGPLSTLKSILEECAACGEDMQIVSQEEPTEVLH